MLAVTASPKCGGGDMGSGSWGLCLWDEISTGPWMVHSNSIKTINKLASRVVCKNGKEEKLTPTLVVAASPDCSGGAWVAAAWDYVFFPRCQLACG